MTRRDEKCTSSEDTVLPAKTLWFLVCHPFLHRVPCLGNLKCSRARTLLSSSFPWFATLRSYLNLHFCVRHPLSVPVLAWSQIQLPTPLRTLTPSLLPIPQGVAAIVVPNKVYGITDLWNWIFSLHQSSGITALRPVASGHNWPVTELFFPHCTLKVGRSRNWCANSSGDDRKTGRFMYLCIYLAIKLILNQTPFWLLCLCFCFSHVDHSLLLCLSSQLLTVFDLILI